MSILICGGAGYIGSHINKLLANKGYDMTPWADAPMRNDNRSSKKKLAVKVYKALPNSMAVGIAGLLHANIVPMIRGSK